MWMDVRIAEPFLAFLPNYKRGPLVNPYEHRIRDWGLFVEGQLPVVIGNDIAGIVCAVGPSMETTLQPGDHVFGRTNYLKKTSDQASLQEYAVLDAFTVAKVPEGFTDDDGASLVCNLVAPFWAVFGKDGLALPIPVSRRAETHDQL